MLGMANHTNRIPLVNIENVRVMEKMMALSQVFPDLINQLNFALLPKTTFYEFSIGRDACCRFNEENFEKLRRQPERMLSAYGVYFQSWKYFWSIRRSVVEWLRPNSFIEKLVNTTFPRSFITDNVQVIENLLVEGLWYLARIFEHEDQKVIDAPEFRLILVSSMKPELDLGIAHKLCNQVILTAPASTFGWFMGFLGKGGNATVFYSEEARPYASTRSADGKRAMQVPIPPVIQKLPTKSYFAQQYN
ncbi:unnamed protein product, partial [Mesorhabditis belari]|uniref:Uncharacterized protein n=1 Tax=Mesorhabditis belari TaxID=2138241 RepID=A0AAF3FL83_9BILA